MNCLIYDNENPEKSLKGLIEKDTTLKLMAVSSSPDEIIKLVNQTKIDIVFINGDLANALDITSGLPSFTQFVVFSEKESIAAKAFELGATDYLISPIEKARFDKSIHKANDKSLILALKSDKNQDIFVRSEYKVIKISFDKLLYVEALADYVVFHTSDGSKHIVHSTMKGTFDRLPQDKFIRIHRSYIISRDKIDSIDNQSVIMGDKTLPIGALYKDSFYERLNFL